MFMTILEVLLRIIYYILVALFVISLIAAPFVYKHRKELQHWYEIHFE